MMDGQLPWPDWEVGMRFHVRFSPLALIACAILAVSASAAQASAGVESFFAAHCKVNTCKKEKGETPAEELAKAEVEQFTQAGGHPNFGISDFTVNNVEVKGKPGVFEPEGVVTHVRTDVPPGDSTNPETVAKCTFEEFGKELAGTPFFSEPKCIQKTESGATAEIGVNKVVVYGGPFGDLELEGNIYNLVQPKGLASDFGVALKLPKAVTEAILSGTPYKGTPAEKGQYYAHTLIEGSVEWGAEAAGTGKADYHDYFEINVSPALPLISSRLIFKGNVGERGFITKPTSCSGTGPQTTTTLKLKYQKGESAEAKYTTPIGVENCGLVPFNPGFTLAQSTKGSDLTDGLTTEFTLPHNTVEEEEKLEIYDSSRVKKAEVRLPEGLTLNPSAAAGLEACTPEQIGIEKGVFVRKPVPHISEQINCPEGSKLGTVTLNVPGLPSGSLLGNVFLGGPATGPITGPPYVIYVAAESEHYGVLERLKGETTPNETTGQLTTTFKENPEQPFTNLVVHFNKGPLAPLANPLKCEASAATTLFTPFTNTAAKAPTAVFEVTGCSGTPPFSPTQSTSSEPAQGGANTTFTQSVVRPQGNQYLAADRVVLPPGLVGAIPTVTLCGEAQANAGTCTSASQIGTVVVAAGSGAPYNFNGKVFLTGPFEGAPYGLSIVVQPVAGPFRLKPVVARARIEIKSDTAQVIFTDTKVPNIAGGIPTRLRSLAVSINRQGFERNPTNCAVLATETTLTGSLGATAKVSTPFQAEGCNLLAFKPSFSASTSGKTSRANGASLEVKIGQGGGEANIRSVTTSLPKALPSRLTTLQKACLEATFAANPLSCPAGSNVGTATAVTPVLRNPMTGLAYLVSHGGAAFPDLDLVLEGNGVRVILVGNTDIKRGITTTTFASSPDVPVSSFVLKLPTGPHSALAAFGSLCIQKLLMPTSIVAQNGAQFKQNTLISKTGCPVRIARRRVAGNTAIVTVQTYEAGRLSAGGSSLKGVVRRLSKAGTTTLRLSLSSSGRRRHRPFRTRVRVGFVPSNKGPHSTASTVVTFH
jgi:hypothetical protein